MRSAAWHRLRKKLVAQEIKNLIIFTADKSICTRTSQAGKNNNPTQVMEWMEILMTEKIPLSQYKQVNK